MYYSNKTHVILIRDENDDWCVRTEDISTVKEDKPSKKCFVCFYKGNNPDTEKGKLYPYSQDRVVILKKPEVLNPSENKVFYLGELQENVYAICHFKENPKFKYWTIAFQDSRPDIVCKDDAIRIEKSSTPATKSKDGLRYLTQMSYLHHYDIRYGDENKVLLGEQYEHLRRGDSAPLLEAFLAPEGFQNTKNSICDIPIYPFCSNSSQFDALNNALTKKISVIQGPPGTGKTETILNILMNLVICGKTAMVVAGSNSATDNIIDKLKEEKLDFLVARLGSKDYKEDFIKKQCQGNLCPDEWSNKTFDEDSTLKGIKGLSSKLKYLYEKDADLHIAIEKGDKSKENILRIELEKSKYNEKRQQLKSLSLAFLKQMMYNRFGDNYIRGRYSFDDIGEDSTRYDDFLKDYPIVLSTAYSATKCIARTSTVDYIIMDEASQIDLSTGLLALSVAKNTIIVGDLKQLPNVIKKEMAEVSQAIFDFYQIDKRFNYATNNILQAICKMQPNDPGTMLKEHYRCHPKIARFFNNEFYKGKLVCMREDHGEENVLILRQTVRGNHAADFTNNREEEEMEDVISDYDIPINNETVGIITPYKNQVKRIANDKDIDKKIYYPNTVHKYQGLQRDTIIISTVDNQYSDFINDPHLLNVSVSRAKNQLIIVTNGNEGNTGPLHDLVEYITENGIHEDGEITSLFDLLYPSYNEELEKYFQRHSQIPHCYYQCNDKPSTAEKIAYGFISKVLTDFPELTEMYEYPLKFLIKDRSILSDEEWEYINKSYPIKDSVSKERPHIDFMIFRKKVMEPILAIEIDGESYHQEGSFQCDKDRLKDSIMEKCGIPLKRFRTKESINEEETLRKILSLTITQ